MRKPFKVPHPEGGHFLFAFLKMVSLVSNSVAITARNAAIRHGINPSQVWAVELRLGHRS